MNQRPKLAERATDYQRGYNLATEEWKAICQTVSDTAYRKGIEHQQRNQEKIAWLNLFLVVFDAVLAAYCLLGFISFIVTHVL